MRTDFSHLEDIARSVRRDILIATTAAGSGHPTSSLSGTDLAVALFFGGFFRYDIAQPNFPNNDRFILSKGHAAPLLYALYAAAGAVEREELKTVRLFGSRLEGHPTLAFPHTEAATGSLGQGLSVGVGMALNGKYLDKLSYRTVVLMGDSEIAEGSVWEAAASAAHYKLDNLTAIVDVNRLGQRGETLYGHNCRQYEKMFSAFGWNAFVIDGHAMSEICAAYEKIFSPSDKPTVIIAKTIKGKGVSFLEDKEGWHGKAVPAAQLPEALKEIGEGYNEVCPIAPPESLEPKIQPAETLQPFHYESQTPVSTRKAYGNALVRLGGSTPHMVVLDAEVSNSTFAEFFAKKYPSRFFELFIAEQNMVGVALGLSRRGKKPCISTFAAFFARAFDQIRMAQYSNANILFCGSHAGVSIGEDGASQMGLEDIALFRSVRDSIVLYPSDAVSTERLVEEAIFHPGISYLRTTRADTPLLYTQNEEFPIGGSKTLRSSSKDVATVVGAGITLHEALKASDELLAQNIPVRVIDLYSIKPIDSTTLQKAADETKLIITVEDHVPEGGIGEAVRTALANCCVSVVSLAVKKQPKSGKPAQLLDYEEISSSAIVAAVKNFLDNGKNRV